MEGYEIYASTLSVHFALRPCMDPWQYMRCGAAFNKKLWDDVHYRNLGNVLPPTTQETSETAKSHIYSTRSWLKWADMSYGFLCSLLLYTLHHTIHSSSTGQSFLSPSRSDSSDWLPHSFIHRSIVSILDSSYPSLIQQRANSSNKQSRVVDWSTWFLIHRWQPCSPFPRFALARGAVLKRLFPG